MAKVTVLGVRLCDSIKKATADGAVVFYFKYRDIMWVGHYGHRDVGHYGHRERMGGIVKYSYKQIVRSRMVGYQLFRCDFNISAQLFQLISGPHSMI